MTIGADQMSEQGDIQRVSFYFSAHQDDWQLFMNPSAFRDVLEGNTKCVFIHMTAGDAGLGTGNGGRKPAATEAPHEYGARRWRACWRGSLMLAIPVRCALRI
jgi:hypothetical protein